MFKFGHKTTESVGLDIGSHSIKVTSVKKEAEDSTLTAYNIKTIPSQEKAPEMGKLVQETLKEIDLNPEDVNLAISGPNVIVRFVNLPKMNKDQLENAMTFEAEKFIPFNVSEVVMDFIILGDAGEAGQMRVLLAAAKRDFIEERVKSIEKLGMAVNVMDINAFAMFNAYTASYESGEATGKAFFDFGYSQTNVLVSTGDSPFLIRQIQIGGKDITGAIAQDMGISQDKAEELKLHETEENKEKITSLTVPVLEELIKELQLSFSYYENRCNQEVKDIYCSGGVMYQPGVLEYLTERLGVQVKTWDPIKKIKVSDFLSKEDIASVSARLAVSVGLALRD